MNFVHQLKVNFKVTHKYGFESTQKAEDTVMLTDQQLANYTAANQIPRYLARRILVVRELAVRNPNSHISIQDIQEE